MPSEKRPFRYRSHEVSRLEAFSDVIFGFAITLLVVSLEAPKTYAQLIEVMHGLVPFAICFFLFIDFWREHHEFFKRYALQDKPTVALNMVLLFVVLFYVYPLKFVFTLFVNGLAGEHVPLSAEQARTLYTIYGTGFTALFWLMGSMYLYAWSQREVLQLDEVEKLHTKENIWDNFATGAFGLISIAVAWTALRPGLAGAVYFLLCIPKTLIPTYFGRKRRKVGSASTSP